MNNGVIPCIITVISGVVLWLSPEYGFWLLGVAYLAMKAEEK